MSTNLLHSVRSNIDQIRPGEKCKQQLPSHGNMLRTLCGQIRKQFSPLANRPGVHTSSYMTAAGFEYTGNGDAAQCKDCGLEVSNWTKDMNPFTIHSERNPSCQFIHSLKPSSLSNEFSSSLSTIAFRNTSTSNGKANSSKRQKIETTDLESQANTSVEADLINQMRKRTFSHWSQHANLSSAQMIEAGFFNCNVGDRVVCIDCNRFYHQWTPHVDDPCEIHKTTSPDCKFVKEKLIHREPPRIVNPNESLMRIATTHHSLRFSELLRPIAQNNNNRGVQKPVTVSRTTLTNKIPSIDDMILGGFFNTDSKAIEACPYCSKSLQDMGSNNDPMIKHAQWLLHCAHTGQEDDGDGDELYHKTEESQQAKQKCSKGNKLKKTTRFGVMFNNKSTSDSRQLSLRDERIVSRLVAAGFDLSISQRSSNQKSRLSVTSRSLLNRLQINDNDSTTDVDLLIACAILHKQIDYIDGKETNIMIPGEKMNEISEQNTSSESATIRQTTNTINDADRSTNSTLSNPCVLCLIEEKRLACVPCGHWATCVPCGHSLRSCPICRRDVKAFVQVYG